MDLQKAYYCAEAKTVEFMVQHNLPIKSADHLTPLYRELFPDWRIAKKTSCIWTTSLQILNQALQPEAKENLVRSAPFFSTDDSSDTGVEKMNPVLIKLFNVEHSHQVETKFYDMCLTKVSMLEK